MLYRHSISPGMAATLSGEHVERRLAAILAAAEVAGDGREGRQPLHHTLRYVKAAAKPVRYRACLF